MTSQEKKALAAMLIVLSVGILLSIFCLVVFRNWWSWSIPWLIAYVVEYCMRIRIGDFKPPLYRSIVYYIKGRFPRRNSHKIEVKPKVAFKISNSSELSIFNFIQCQFFGNYECLKLHIAIYKAGEIEAHFTELCQQYQEAKKDGGVSKYAGLKGGLLSIEYGWAVVNIYAGMLNERFSEAVAEGLRKLYPQFKFTKSGWRKDIEQVKLIEETTSAMKYERLEKALAKLESARPKDQSNKDQYRNFLSTVRDCSKLFGTIDINTTYMDMLAVYEIGLAEEIKRIEEQIRKQKEK